MSDISLLGKIAGYTEILAKDPRSTVFVSLSETYRQMGMLDDALQIARQGVKALPRYSPGYIALGRILAQRGELDSAISAFEAALGMDRDNLNAIKGLAKVRMLNKQPEEARSLLLRGATIRPEDEGVRKMLSALGPVRSKGVVVPESSLPEEPVVEKPAAGEPIATSTIAEIYVRQGFLKRAMKVYRDLLKQDPRNEELRAKLVALKAQVEALEGSGEGMEPGPPTAPSPVSPSIPPSVPSLSPVRAASEIEVSVPEPAVPLVAPPMPVAPPAANKRLVYQQMLESWLDVIRRRRLHV